MAQDFEQIIFTARLGTDPEMRFLPDGTAVTSFSAAVNRRNGSTIWYRVSVFDKAAEACNQYLEKGRQVLVSGILTPDKDTGNPRIWTGNDGQARTSYEVRAFNVQFLGSGQGNGNSGERQNLNKAMDWDDSDVPF